MKEVKSVEMRCDDRAENLVFSCDNYDGYDITIEDSYCGPRYNRFVRAWKAFWGKPIYYSGVYTEDKEKVKRWLLDCLHLVNETDTMPNSQVINLLFHIANNIDNFVEVTRTTHEAIHTFLHGIATKSTFMIL